MTTYRTSEIGYEADENPVSGRHIESLDDIPREIANRRIQAEFSEFIPAGRAELIRENPDQIENAEAFDDAAKKAGITDTEGLLGWASNPESPAHVRKGEIPREVGTLIHEDLHRLTDLETRREMMADPSLEPLYEGITEYFTKQATEGLHGDQPGEVYPEQVKEAGKLAEEVGEVELRQFFFKNEMADEVRSAIQRLESERKV